MQMTAMKYTNKGKYHEGFLSLAKGLSPALGCVRVGAAYTSCSPWPTQMHKVPWQISDQAYTQISGFPAEQGRSAKAGKALL